MLQVAAAARRQTSWAQSRELAAVAELARRRENAEASGDPDYRVLPAHESTVEEVAAALTLTSQAAATLLHLAEQLTGPLAATGRALEAGRIDLPKARIISDATDNLPNQVADTLQTAALAKAPTQTTGQLRRRIKRIAHRLDPSSITERRRAAERKRRLELWETPSGTADLAVRDLPSDQAHAIYNKITAAAHGLRHDGDTRPLDNIRADLATRLLQGDNLPTATHTLLTTTEEPAPTPADTAAPHPNHTREPANLHGSTAAPTTPGQGKPSKIEPLADAPGARPHPRQPAHPHPPPAAGNKLALHPSLAGAVTRHLPLASGRARLNPHPDAPPGTTDESSVITELADAIDQRLTHVRQRVHPAHLPAAITHAARTITTQLTESRHAACQGQDATHGHPGYRPPAALRREIETRHPTCVFPTCNRQSTHCDLDHTIPWQPGTTCPCNLAPLCRHHHRLKQTPGWTLHHPWPGLLIWTTPTGTWHTTHPHHQ
ncbi:HNH endonuclease signature motif containing protein [Actinomadura terrae]|uniref:HNH endonuclease signature motif containing protein n=1 Tax=Actinomadura terrae TaxID=604353 RepID=UPI001FA7036C|nr:HNH endonuclease signature motif containing protein [Actinomadura terrae]